MLKLAAFVAFLFAVLFFGVAVSEHALWGINLLDAGLFSTALGLAFGSAPA